MSRMSVEQLNMHLHATNDIAMVWCVNGMMTLPLVEAILQVHQTRETVITHAGRIPS